MATVTSTRPNLLALTPTLTNVCLLEVEHLCGLADEVVGEEQLKIYDRVLFQ